MKVYLSGPREPEFRQRFIDAQLALDDLKDCQPVSYLNLILNDQLSWATRLDTCLKELESCTAIFMLRSWGDSIEARRELNRAMELRILQYFEETNDLPNLLHLINSGNA